MAEKPQQKKIYLWTLPRTMSTAVLRAMSTVQGCKGFHEPYQMPFYQHQKTLPEKITFPTSSQYESIRDTLQAEYPGLVFIKEMCKHLPGRLRDPTFIPPSAVHTFLIRHPVKTIKSFIQASMKSFSDLDLEESELEEARSRFFNENAIRAEQSYEFIIELHEFVTTELGQKSVIIDADDLQRDPEGMMRAYCDAVGIEYQDSMVNWGTITDEQMKIWQWELNFPPILHFVGGAIFGTELAQSEPRPAGLEELEEPFRSLARENLPQYEKMRALRLNPRHL